MSHLFFCQEPNCNKTVDKTGEVCTLCNKMNSLTDLTNDIKYIQDKILYKMTYEQKCDWRYLLERKQDKLIKLKIEITKCS
jgi:hypothetical protein